MRLAACECALVCVRMYVCVDGGYRPLRARSRECTICASVCFCGRVDSEFFCFFSSVRVLFFAKCASTVVLTRRVRGLIA